jgi:hypothetical protein
MLFVGCGKQPAKVADTSRLQEDLLAAQVQVRQVRLTEGFSEAPEIIRSRNNLKEAIRAQRQELTANQSNTVAMVSELLDAFIHAGLQYANGGRSLSQYQVMTNLQAGTVHAIDYAVHNLQREQQ